MTQFLRTTLQAGSRSRQLALRLALMFAAAWTSSASATELDDYVNTPDPAFRYELHAPSTVTKPTHESRVYHLVSQNWLTSEEVDRTLWEHWVTVCIPNDREHAEALIMIGGGGNGGEAPSPSGALDQIALQTKSVVVEIKQIPNQPLHFKGEQMDA